MKNITVILSILTMALFNAQNPTEYARKVVDRLASDEFAGRGYTHQGLEKAQNEIVSQFEKIGLKKFNNSYLQELSYPINIVEDVKVSVNGKSLTYGKDYILYGASKPDKGKEPLYYFNTSVIDSFFIYHNNEDLFNEIDRLKGKSIVFPTVQFQPGYVMDGVSANDIYREIKLGYQKGDYGKGNKFLIEIEPGKLTASLSKETSDTHLMMMKYGLFNQPLREIEYDIKSHYEPNFKTNNVIGYIEGKDPSKKIIISAHYDHLGQVSDAIFTGANDNASGVAMMLSMAKYYSVHQPKYTMVFIAFTGEEAGLQGSTYFVNHPPFPLNEIALVCNFDIVGTGDEGIQIVNSAKYPKIYQTLDQINQKHTLVQQVKKRGEACNSDHCPFDQKGIPAIFTYTLGGYPYYHDIDDRPENLTLKEFEDVFYLFKIYFDDYLP